MWNINRNHKNSEFVSKEIIDKKNKSQYTTCFQCKRQSYETISIDKIIKTKVKWRNSGEITIHYIKETIYIEVCWICGHIYRELQEREVDEDGREI